MRVWSQTEEGAVELARIVATFQRRVDGYLRLELEDGRLIRVTAEHPLWDPKRGEYRLAGTFRPGEAIWEHAFADDTAAHHRQFTAARLPDLIATLTHELMPARPVAALVADGWPTHPTHAGTGSGSTRIRAILPLEGSVQVFNLTVGGSHTYFAEGVLVHNKIQ